MSPHRRAYVELRIPAAGEYAAVVRTTTAGLAARLDFTIGDIEDLRIAIGEAVALALGESADGADLTCSFRLAPGRIEVTLDTESATGAPVDARSFAWQVLDTMADDLHHQSSDGRFTVSFSVSSQLSSTTGDDHSR